MDDWTWDPNLKIWFRLDTATSDWRDKEANYALTSPSGTVYFRTEADFEVALDKFYRSKK